MILIFFYSIAVAPLQCGDALALLPRHQFNNTPLACRRQLQNSSAAELAKRWRNELRCGRGVVEPPDNG